MQLNDKSFEPFISADDIQKKVIELGSGLNLSYSGKQPLFIIVLNGAFIFGSDLIRHFNGECEITFVKVESYAGTQSQGIKSFSDFNIDVSQKHIIIVEDIIDSGNTLHFLQEQLMHKEALSIISIALLQKQIKRANDIQADIVGFEIPDVFVVGYGLDYNGAGRNLKDIWRIQS